MEMISTEEAARRKDTGRHTILRAIKREQLDGEKVGGRYLVKVNRRFQGWQKSARHSKAGKTRRTQITSRDHAQDRSTVLRLGKYNGFEDDGSLKVYQFSPVQRRKRAFRWRHGPGHLPTLLAVPISAYQKELSFANLEAAIGRHIYAVSASEEINEIGHLLAILAMRARSYNRKSDLRRITKMRDLLEAVEKGFTASVPTSLSQSAGVRQLVKNGGILPAEGARKRLMLLMDVLLKVVTNLTAENRLEHIRRLLIHMGFDDGDLSVEPDDPEALKGRERIRKFVSPDRTRTEREQLLRSLKMG